MLNVLDDVLNVLRLGNGGVEVYGMSKRKTVSVAKSSYSLDKKRFPLQEDLQHAEGLMRVTLQHRRICSTKVLCVFEQYVNAKSCQNRYVLFMFAKFICVSGRPFCVVSSFVSVVQVPAECAEPAEPAEPGPIRLLPEWLGQAK